MYFRRLMDYWTVSGTTVRVDFYQLIDAFGLENWIHFDIQQVLDFNVTEL